LYGVSAVALAGRAVGGFVHGGARLARLVVRAAQLVALGLGVLGALLRLLGALRLLADGGGASADGAGRGAGELPGGEAEGFVHRVAFGLQLAYGGFGGGDALPLLFHGALLPALAGAGSVVLADLGLDGGAE